MRPLTKALPTLYVIHLSTLAFLSKDEAASAKVPNGNGVESKDSKTEAQRKPTQVSRINEFPLEYVLNEYQN